SAGRVQRRLQVGGRAVVRWAAARIDGHVDALVIVSGRDDTAMRQALSDLTVRFVAKPRPQDGQGSSIAVGVGALKPWTRAALIALGDQPRIPDAVVRALIEAFQRSGKAIVAPVYPGEQGTPVVFSAE